MGNDFPATVMVAEGSRSMSAVNILRRFTGRFTVFSKSELPNSIATGVVYWLLRTLNFASCAMSCS